MRKALIAVAVASALFAVGAFAASFAVQSEDIASGANDVVACAAKVDVDFADPVLNTTTGAWTVANATVTFLNTANAPVATCAGFDAELALKIGPNADAAVYLASPTYTTPVPDGVTGSSHTFTFATGGIDVATIYGASVVVDGKFLSVDVP